MGIMTTNRAVVMMKRTVSFETAERDVDVILLEVGEVFIESKSVIPRDCFQPIHSGYTVLQNQAATKV